MFEEKYSRTENGIVRKIVIDGYVHESHIHTLDTTQNPSLAWWQAYLKGDRAKSISQGHDREVKVIDLFSGCGGLGLGVMEGLNAVGFKPSIEFAVDVDEEGLEVYQHNLKANRIIHGSVASLVDFQVFGQGNSAEFAFPPEVLNEEMAAQKGKIDVICAGPPCQGHSNLNNHSRREDPRNLLYLAVPAIALGLDVPVVIIENVPEVTSDKFGVVQTAESVLKAAGYHVSDCVIHSVNLGCAQTRKRFFLVASKHQHHKPLKEVVKALVKPEVDLQWAIEDLLEAPADSIMNAVPAFSLENQRRIDFLFDANVFDLPNDIRPDCHKNGHTYGSVYGRLHWNKPSQTITTGFLTPGRGRYIHPLKRRVITPHEAARIQAFPDWFEFCLPGKPQPSRAKLTKWIGDAVPVVMGYAAALCAATAMIDKSRDSGCLHC